MRTKFRHMRVCLFFASFVLVHASTFAQAPGDERWDIRFGLPGSDNIALSVATKGNDIYIGGDISLAGARNVNHIAKWDGTDWSALGSGIEGGTNFTFVYSLVFKGNDLYVGGIFTNAGSLPARGIAKWDGTNWSALPGIFNADIFGLAVNGNDLYVAGLFHIGSDTNLYSFAKFDGANWTTFGSIVSGCVGSFCTPLAGSILIDGTDIYVGGSFTTFAGVAANSIVRWNGAQWNPLSTGLTGTNVSAQSITKYGGRIVVGGSFTSAGGVLASNIACWDGVNWSPLGNPNNTLLKTFSDGADLYASGNFTRIGGVAAVRIARWDGANWTALGAGMNGGVYGLARTQTGDLLAAGQFTSAGNAGAADIARWDGSNWSSVGGNVGNGMNRVIGFVRAIDAAGGDVYAGGVFSSAGGVLANRVAKWNGSAWSALGAGVAGPTTMQVRSIAHSGNDVYCGGVFTNIGGVNATNIAKWDGAAWSALGSSLNSNVNALAVSGGELYAGGAFTMAGALPVNRVAKWTGTGWLQLGTGMNSNVNALVTGPNGDVYAGGTFTNAGGITANKVAKWNNATGWTPLGNGINFGVVAALAVSGSNLYVAGSFSFADSLAANNIARWDGANWSALGSGLQLNSLSAQVSALAVRGNEVFAGGAITNAGGVPVQAIARWDGTNWSSVGSGLSANPGNAGVFALAIGGNSLWLGGNFIRAGSKPSANFGRWLLDVPSIQLTNPSLPAGGPFHFHTTGLLGLKFRVDATPDLNHWTTLLHANAFTDTYDFTADTPPGTTELFRVVAE